MTLEQRARLIADCGGRLSPGSYHHRLVEACALKHLREAVEQAMQRSGSDWPTHKEWV